MKSIKEKADEKYPIITGESQTYNEKFVEGANYVLDAIIECLPNTHSFNLNEVIDIITSRIKELKSNQ